MFGDESLHFRGLLFHLDYGQLGKWQPRRLLALLLMITSRLLLALLEARRAHYLAKHLCLLDNPPRGAVAGRAAGALHLGALFVSGRDLGDVCPADLADLPLLLLDTHCCWKFVSWSLVLKAVAGGLMNKCVCQRRF